LHTSVVGQLPQLIDWPQSSIRPQAFTPIAEQMLGTHPSPLTAPSERKIGPESVLALPPLSSPAPFPPSSVVPLPLSPDPVAELSSPEPVDEPSSPPPTLPSALLAVPSTLASPPAPSRLVTPLAPPHASGAIDRTIVAKREHARERGRTV
jgi:hypothetical protein